MSTRVHTIAKHPRAGRLSSLKDGLLAFVLHKQINFLGSALFGLFLPIFLFEFFGYRIWAVLLWGAVYYFGAIVAEPLGAIVMTKIGLKKAMALGVLLYVGFFAALLLKDILPLWSVTVLSLSFFIAWHVIYWVPFHTAFAESTPRRHLGSAVGFLNASCSVISVIVPILSAWLIVSFGYSVLLIVAGLIILFSILPIFFLSVEKEKFEFGFWQTFKILFSKKERGLLILYAAEGAENAVGFLVWPIFVFLLFRGKYLEVGTVATAVVFFSILLQLVVGRLSDRFNPQKIFQWGTGLTSFGWLLRIFVSSAAQVFFAGVFYSLSAILMNTPFEAIMYARAADAGHYVDEYTVLREMALGVGRTLILVLSAILVSFIGFPAAFFLAALAVVVFGAAVRWPYRTDLAE